MGDLYKNFYGNERSHSQIKNLNQILIRKLTPLVSDCSYDIEEQRAKKKKKKRSGKTKTHSGSFRQQIIADFHGFNNLVAEFRLASFELKL